jgi:hypothetical protein
VVSKETKIPRIIIVFVVFVFGLLLACLSSSTPIRGQVAGATVAGTIVDPSGGGVPNAQIVIKRLSTGVTTNVSTDTAGFYTVPNLLPGEYSVSVTAPGFSTETRSSVTLSVGAQQVLNFTMEVGQVSQTVEVTTEAPTVELTSLAITDQVNGTTVRELPLNGRDWTSLATLQPGVVSMAASQPAIASTTNATGRAIRGFGDQLAIAGSRPGQDNYRLDGISENDYSKSSPGSVLGGAIGVDGISEFSVLTSNYGAEYGRTSGGVVNAITRSGTNQFHGTAYEFLRNSDLDARNFFDPAQIPPFRRNQFGASGGAPIVKNHTFVFANFEQISQSLGTTTLDVVPSPGMTQGLLNYSSPAAFLTRCVATSVTNQCQVAINLDIQPYLGLWRAPNQGLLGLGNTGIYSFQGQQISTARFFTTRVDQKFSDKDSVDGSFVWDSAGTTLPDGLNDTLMGQNTGHELVALEENHVFSASLVNSLRFGFNRSTTDAGTGLSTIDPVAGDLALGAVSGRTSPDLQPSGLTKL